MILEGDRPRVLVVDDEPVIVEALRRVLGSAGFEVDTAEDAEAATRRLEDFAPGLIVVDLKMPGMSGIEFLQQATDESRTFVLMSGYASSENIVESLQAGAFGFLSKPFTFEEARSLVFRAARFRSFQTADRTPHAGTKAVTGFLGVQSWARLLPDGTALVGVTDVFVRTTGRITSVEPPTVSFPLLQGDVMVRVTGDLGYPFVTWTPVGGQVLETNPALDREIGLLCDDPYGEGWVARIQPLDAAEDLGRLTKRFG